jgi:hypothetical protein
MNENGRTPSLLHNWISIFGIIIAGCALFAVLFLIAIDFFRGFTHPYLGILTYIVVPAFLILGLSLTLFGLWRERSRRRRLAPGEVPAHLRIDFNVPGQRNAFIVTLIITFVFLALTSFGTYQTYHFTESVQFCGQTCHTVMKPEHTAYQNSPHARVTCTQCHIGPGADWFVRSKLSGSYQVYATLTNKYPRPIPTPIKNLRPAQDTCEQCHWPKKFFGAVQRVNRHYLADEQNSPWTIALLMKIGGGDPEQGPTGGIHWHMNIANKIEYIHTDEQRQVIPWVRLTSKDGKVTVYQSTDSPLSAEQLKLQPRVMDCIDCHNRPSHIYNPPSRSVNVAMGTGRLDPSLPFIKMNSVEVLTVEYKNSAEALKKIETSLLEKYKDYPDKNKVNKAIKEIQKIYSQNFFPEMKVDWRTYPNNVGHTIYPGCYRCHDGKHTSSDGKVISHDCSSCHMIIAQGSEQPPKLIAPQGLEFEHPVDIGDVWKEMNCAECHTGGPI